MLVTEAIEEQFRVEDAWCEDFGRVQVVRGEDDGGENERKRATENLPFERKLSADRRR
jgi:hypothetical protein